jgi:hypothetical protein
MVDEYPRIPCPAAWVVSGNDALCPIGRGAFGARREIARDRPPNDSGPNRPGVAWFARTRRVEVDEGA